MNPNASVLSLLSALIIVAICAELEMALRPCPCPCSRPRALLVAACLPRIEKSTGKPFFWSLFGQKGGDNDDDDDDDDEALDIDGQLKGKALWTTADWVVKHKYALEVHNLTTSDGYQLQLHRLPQPGHRPVLLVHGLLTSSLSWVLRGPGKSLAFLLYDKEYDVWLANLRGSTHGRAHTSVNTTSADFWSYSFHEMGAFDLAAIIDRIRNESSFHQVSLITHSQGFNAFLVLCSVQPEYNERILFVQALAPIVELKNKTNFGPKDMRKVLKFLKGKSKANSYELFPAGDLKAKCLTSSADERKACAKVMQMIAGLEQYPKSLQPIIYGQLLRGGSLKELQHLTQIWQSGDFVAYDYGVEGNRQLYNTVDPLNYDLRRVTVPLVLHFGATDALATPAGVHSIYAQVLHSVMGVYRVAADTFNHLDFLCANDVGSLVNDKLIALMEKYFSGQLAYVIE